MADWYVLQSKAKHEAIAERNLGNQGFITFLPKLSVQRHLRGRWHSVCEPLFPGYIFIELDLERQNTAPIRSTRGVIRLVRLGASLQPFPESLLHALMQAQTGSGDAIDPAKLFKSGDEVMLINGPMAGLTAIFKARNSQERVVLLLNIMGNETQVSVSPHQIAKAS
jgi:transcriptional antiterminator RfaH